MRNRAARSSSTRSPPCCRSAIATGWQRGAEVAHVSRPSPTARAQARPARQSRRELLSEGEIETLRHLAREGMGANTLRAMASDLAYLEAWSLAASGGPLPWPAPEWLVLRFVAHHLYDPARRADDPSHGMPGAVEAALRRDGRLRAGGPHAPSTVRRRLALWSTFHRWLGLDGPFSSPNLRGALRLAARAARRPRGRKSIRPLTRDVLERLIATCADGGLADKRDAALLLLAFASGGRRRSEIAGFRIEDLVERPPVLASPDEPSGRKLPVLALRLGAPRRRAAKTTSVFSPSGGRSRR